MKLPKWVTSNAESVRAEVQEWIGTTPQERWRLAELCARDVIWAANMSGTPARILDYEDPLPESSLQALRRLRKAHGWGDAG